MARQHYPGVHRSARQCRAFLEREMARQVYQRFLAQDCVIRQHSIEIGAEPVGEVFRLDGAAKPTRVKCPRNPVAELDPCYAIADRNGS
jgi:hypothetical protein